MNRIVIVMIERVWGVVHGIRSRTRLLVKTVVLNELLLFAVKGRVHKVVVAMQIIIIAKLVGACLRRASFERISLLGDTPLIFLESSHLLGII